MKQILLNPGPINVSDRVRAALGRGDACHREPEVAESVAHTRSLIGQLFSPNGSHQVVFFTGSGTAALEAAVIAGPGAGGLLVIENGVYGSRLRAIAQAHGIRTVSLSSAWNERPDLDRFEALLEADEGLEYVALVHHETTTGLLNPVREIAAIAHKHGRRVMLDTVSGLGGEELDLEGWDIDIAASTANKCLCGLPGISFVLFKSELLELERPRRSLYFDLETNWRAQQQGCGAFTPAVQVLWALEAALEELLEETLAGRIERFRRVSGQLRAGFEDLGLSLYLPAAWRSNTITSIQLPADLSYERLHDRLKARGFVIYAGQGPLRETLFRVANMGQVSDADYERFLAVLGEELR